MLALVAEDDPICRSTLTHLLTRWGYEVILAHDGNEAWDKLRAEAAPGLAILDWMMPGMDGPEICRRMRAIHGEHYVYILLLTARNEEKDLVDGMEAGADDYLTKPFSAQELRVRLRAGTRILQLQEQLLLAQEALRERATHDCLTRLWNRRTILEILERELARGAREGSSVAAVMADLDHFKQVNDRYGHHAGDAVLEESARRMRARMRPYDALGRYGGEEFLAVLPHCDQASGVLQAERLREAVGGEPFHAGGETFSLTCSLGVACAGPGEGSQADLLVRSADAALYTAKRLGRNRAAFASAPPAAIAAVSST